MMETIDTGPASADFFLDAVIAAARPLPPAVYPTWMAYEIARALNAAKVDDHAFETIGMEGSANQQPVTLTVKDKVTGQHYRIAVSTEGK